MSSWNSVDTKSIPKLNEDEALIVYICILLMLVKTLIADRLNKAIDITFHE